MHHEETPTEKVKCKEVVMNNQYWKRIVDDYKKSDFIHNYIVLEFFEGKQKSLLEFENGFDFSVSSILDTIEATRRMYEENTDDKIRLDLWSIHLQTITMLENVLLINSKKISS